jgi:hypothetical protein
MSKYRAGTAVAVACTLALTSVSLSSAQATSDALRSSSTAHGAKDADPRTNAVVKWNTYAGEAAVAACLSPVTNPLHESRMYAIMHLSVHDALQAIHRTAQPYAFDERARFASARAAVTGAAHTALTGVLDDLADVLEPSCLEAALQVVDRAYATATEQLPDGPRTERGLHVGEAAADALLTLRRSDGAETPLVVADFPQGDDPGEWRFTPERPFAFAPGWGEVEPFGLASPNQFRPRPPYRLASLRYARDLRQVKRLGSDGISHPSARSEEQTEIAMFWVESSPLSWNRLGRSLAMDHQLDLWDSARLFGLLNIAMADGYIASFATKYQDSFWRPVTAIRRAGHDGNPRTRPDRDWAPLVVTPPIPDHDSAHAVEGGAAASVFARFFGTDTMTFEVCSGTVPAGGQCTDAAPINRRFDSFHDAARENAISRVYVGFHFRHAARAGTRHGYRIGDWTADNLLRSDAYCG